MITEAGITELKYYLNNEGCEKEVYLTNDVHANFTNCVDSLNYCF